MGILTRFGKLNIVYRLLEKKPSKHSESTTILIGVI